MDPDDIDLEGAIGAALDEQEIAPEVGEQQRAAPKDTAFPTAEDLAAKAPKDAAPKEYVREGRRFVLKDGKETEVKDAAVAEPIAKPWSPLWLKQEHGVEWDKLPEQFRKALEQREKEAAQGIEKHATTAKAWDPVNQLLAPHAQQLAAAGSSPQQYVSQLVQADGYLRQSPVEALNWLCQQYLQCDVLALADWMTQQGVQPQKIDPVQQELAALKQTVEQLRQYPQQQALAEQDKQISAWAKDKPHFAEVRQDMSALATKYPQATLDELYDRATWAHPQIRERILEDQRKAEVKRARDNSLGTRGTPTPNGSARSSPKLSLEEEIGMLLDGGAV